MDRIIKKVLNQIERNGFEAYIVGGYVRDWLLGRLSFDVDICTNARPKDLKKIFPKANGSNYGTLNFKIKKYDFEITTYRREKGYAGHQPLSIEYINNLIEDLQRRDFTINTMCLNEKNDIIDLLHGYEDLKHKLIKTVGNANQKIKEDPLRILRAIRLATVLDFELDEQLYQALKVNGSQIKFLSQYRIKEELSKILIDVHYLKGLSLLEELDLKQYLGISFNNLVKTDDLIGMWAQIKVSSAFPFTKEEKTYLKVIKQIIKTGIIDNYTLYNNGLYLCCVAGDILGISRLQINQMNQKLPLHSVKDLALSALEIIDYFPEKRKLKPRVLIDDIIFKILKGELKNTRQDLTLYLKKIKEDSKSEN